MKVGIGYQDMEPKLQQVTPSSDQHALFAFIAVLLVIRMQMDDVKPAEIEPEIDEDDFSELTTYLEQSAEEDLKVELDNKCTCTCASS